MSSTPVPYSPQPAGTEVAPLYPRFERARQGRVVAGVCQGLAHHLGVRVAWVRLALIILSLVNALGLFFYAGVWIVTKPEPKESAKAREKEASTSGGARLSYWLLVVLAVFGAGASLTLTTGLGVGTIVPFIVVGVGALMVWLAYDRGLESGRNIAVIITGGVVMLAAIVVVVISWDSQAGFGAALAAVVLTLVGVAALGVPLWIRLWDALSQERAEKAAAAERADIASRLHDSVLQTLALIQKRADDPAEVTTLARRQERELRQWLFESQDKTPQTAGTIFTAIDRACGEVEDLYGLRISPVTVGNDEALTEKIQAAVLAAREAMVNVAKHADVETADVYAEVLAGELNIFVRDRGAGFDPDDVPDGHHGLAESIHGRVERAGGSVRVRSTMGEGTEVAITMAV